MRFRHLRGVTWFALLLSLAVLAGAPAAGQAPARSFLWKVQSGTEVLYLAGSIHAMTSDVYPLGAAYQRAFEASDTLVEEIDLTNASALSAMPVLMARGVYRDGRTFDTVVSPETAALVAERLEVVPGMMQLLRPMKPWVITLMLTALQVQRAGLDPALGLDQHFFNEAAGSGKTVVGLETVDEQLELFDGMSDGAQEQMLRSTLNDLDSNDGQLKQVLAAWKRGDAASVEKNVLGGFAGLPEAYDALVVQRNHQWMPRLEACLAARQRCFVVVGAAHLVGPDGLLTLFSKRGYTIEQQ